MPYFDDTGSITNQAPAWASNLPGFSLTPAPAAQPNFLTAGLSSGFHGLLGDVGSVGQAIGSATGWDGLRDASAGFAKSQQQQAQANGRPDLEQNPWSLEGVGYKVAQALPSLAGFGLATALTPEAAVPAWLARIGAIAPRAIGGLGGATTLAKLAPEGLDAVASAYKAGTVGFGRAVLGGAAIGVPQAIGGTVEALQQRHPDQPLTQQEGLEALAVGAPEGALAGLFPNTLGKGGGASLPGMILRGAATGASVNAIQSGLQTGITSYLTDPNLPVADRAKMVVDSAMSGGVIGGILGGAGGAVHGFFKSSDPVIANDPAAVTPNDLKSATDGLLPPPPPTVPGPAGTQGEFDLGGGYQTEKPTGPTQPMTGLSGMTTESLLAFRNDPTTLRGATGGPLEPSDNALNVAIQDEIARRTAPGNPPGQGELFTPEQMGSRVPQIQAMKDQFLGDAPKDSPLVRDFNAANEPELVNWLNDKVSKTSPVWLKDLAKRYGVLGDDPDTRVEKLNTQLDQTIDQRDQEARSGNQTAFQKLNAKSVDIRTQLFEAQRLQDLHNQASDLLDKPVTAPDGQLNLQGGSGVAPERAPSAPETPPDLTDPAQMSLFTRSQTGERDAAVQNFRDSLLPNTKDRSSINQLDVENEPELIRALKDRLDQSDNPGARPIDAAEKALMVKYGVSDKGLGDFGLKGLTEQHDDLTNKYEALWKQAADAGINTAQGAQIAQKAQAMRTPGGALAENERLQDLHQQAFNGSNVEVPDIVRQRHADAYTALMRMKQVPIGDPTLRAQVHDKLDKGLASIARNDKTANANAARHLKAVNKLLADNKVDTTPIKEPVVDPATVLGSNVSGPLSPPEVPVKVSKQERAKGAKVGLEPAPEAPVAAPIKAPLKGARKLTQALASKETPAPAPAPEPTPALPDVEKVDRVASNERQAQQIRTDDAIEAVAKALDEVKEPTKSRTGAKKLSQKADQPANVDGALFAIKRALGDEDTPVVEKKTKGAKKLSQREVPAALDKHDQLLDAMHRLMDRLDENTAQHTVLAKLVARFLDGETPKSFRDVVQEERSKAIDIPREEVKAPEPQGFVAKTPEEVAAMDPFSRAVYEVELEEHQDPALKAQRDVQRAKADATIKAYNPTLERPPAREETRRPVSAPDEFGDDEFGRLAREMRDRSDELDRDQGANDAKEAVAPEPVAPTPARPIKTGWEWYVENLTDQFKKDNPNAVKFEADTTPDPTIGKIDRDTVESRERNSQVIDQALGFVKGDPEASRELEAARTIPGLRDQTNAMRSALRMYVYRKMYGVADGFSIPDAVRQAAHETDPRAIMYRLENLKAGYPSKVLSFLFDNKGSLDIGAVKRSFASLLDTVKNFFSDQSGELKLSKTKQDIADRAIRIYEQAKASRAFAEPDLAVLRKRAFEARAGLKLTKLPEGFGYHVQQRKIYNTLTSGIGGDGKKLTDQFGHKLGPKSNVLGQSMRAFLRDNSGAVGADRSRHILSSEPAHDAPAMEDRVRVVSKLADDVRTTVLRSGVNHAMQGGALWRKFKLAWGTGGNMERMHASQLPSGVDHYTTKQQQYTIGKIKNKTFYAAMRPFINLANRDPRDQEKVAKYLFERTANKNLNPEVRFADHPTEITTGPDAAKNQLAHAKLVSMTDSLRTGGLKNAADAILRAGQMDNYMQSAAQMWNLGQAYAKMGKPLAGFIENPDKVFQQMTVAHDDVTGVAGRDFYRDQANKMLASIDNRIKEENARIAAFMGPDGKPTKEYTAGLAETQDLRAMSRMITARNAQAALNSYIPLTRPPGDFFVSAKLANLTTAPKALAAALNKSGFHDVGVFGDPSNTSFFTRVETREQMTRMAKMLGDLGDHLSDEEPIKMGFPDQVNVFQNMGSKDLQDQLASTENLIRSTMPEGVQPEAIEAMVREAKLRWLDAMPDHSLVKSLQERSYAQGFNTNLAQALAQHFAASARATSSVSMAHEMADVRARMRQEVQQAKSDPNRTATQTTIPQEVAQEIMRREAEASQQAGNPVLNKLRGYVHAASIGFNPAYTLTATSTIPMLGVPELAKTHGYATAIKLVAQNMPEAFRVMKAVFQAKDFEGNANLADRYQVGFRADALRRAGRTEKTIDTIMKADNAGALSGNTNTHYMAGLSSGEIDPSRASMEHKVNAMGLYSETLPRVAMALAAAQAYDARPVPGISRDEFVNKVVNRSQFEYSEGTNSRMLGNHGLAGPLSPIMLSFMNFHTKMIEKLYSEVHTLIKGDTPEERRQAGVFLAGHLVATTLLAGSMGLPVAAAFAGAYDKLTNLFTGKDDTDIEGSYRTWLAHTFGKQAGEAIAKGIPRAFAGIDLAHLGDQNLLPFTGLITDKRKFEDAEDDFYKSMGGALGGELGEFYLGARDLLNGDYMMGAQKILPEGLKGLAEGAYIAQHGYINASGQKLPVSAGGLNVLKEILGFKPGELAEYQDKQRIFSGLQAERQYREQNISTHLAKSVLTGDPASLPYWVNEAVQYQRDHPLMGGPIQSLQRSLMLRARQSAQAQALGGTPLGMRPMDISARSKLGF